MIGSCGLFLRKRPADGKDVFNAHGPALYGWILGCILDRNHGGGWAELKATRFFVECAGRGERAHDPAHLFHQSTSLFPRDLAFFNILLIFLSPRGLKALVERTFSSISASSFIPMTAVEMGRLKE